MDGHEVLYKNGMAPLDRENISHSPIARQMYSELYERKIINREYRDYYPGPSRYSFSQAIWIDFALVPVTPHSYIELETIYKEGLSPDNTYIFMTQLHERSLSRTSGNVVLK